MGWPVVTVSSGGIPVTDVSGTNSIGIPVEEAANGFGTPVTYVASGGLGVLGGAGASSFAPYPAPAGYHWDFVTFNGERVTSNGALVVSLVGN